MSTTMFVVRVLDNKNLFLFPACLSKPVLTQLKKYGSCLSVRSVIAFLSPSLRSSNIDMLIADTFYRILPTLHVIDFSPLSDVDKVDED